MSLGSHQSLDNGYSFVAEFPSGFGFTILPEATFGGANLIDYQTITDALRGAGATVSARKIADGYQDILTP